jgi:ATP-dependent DNA ligase
MDRFHQDWILVPMMVLALLGSSLNLLLKPDAVAQIALLEWTGANHLRHTKFVALRDDKDPQKVVRET